MAACRVKLLRQAMTTRRDEVELRKTFVQREKVECAKYEVDMSPGALYGMCICGKPRAEHTEEALQGSKHEAKGRRSEAEVPRVGAPHAARRRPCQESSSYYSSICYRYM